MIVQEQSWESVREELTSWERRVVARPRGGLRVQLVSPSGWTFTTTHGLTSFLQNTRHLDPAQAHQVKTLFRLRKEEKSKKEPVAKRLSRRVSKKTNGEKSNYSAADFSRLLPTEPLSLAELSEVDMITNTKEVEENVEYSSLQDLDDIDFPRLEEMLVCNVPLTFRKEILTAISAILSLISFCQSLEGLL